MPYSVDNPPDKIKNMPEGAQKIWVAAFNSAYDGTCKSSDDREACAHKIAYSAVKKKYKKSGDKWVPKSNAIVEFSMTVVKASLHKATQEMRWRAVASDTDWDQYGERMSLELFNDFVRRIEDELPVPEPFSSVVCEDGWCGGMPYLSVAHYKSGGGKNVPGEPLAVYVDGNRLKARGILYKNKLGHAVFDAMLEDLYGKKEKSENKIRISIGFIDLEHSHGDFVFTRTELGQVCPMCLAGEGNKTYLKGQLVHLALTRVPVNPRTLMEVDRAMGDIITKRDDAASIVGEDLADELDNSLEEKSLASGDGMQVIKGKD